MHMFGTLFGFPALGLLIMRQNRTIHVFCVTAYVAFSMPFLTVHANVPRIFYRTGASLEVFHIILAVHSFYRERSERQLFLLRQQLNTQYRSVQSAQAMERKAEQTTKRFVSYVLHEVRVPLNTALLAVQNLDGEGVFEDIGGDNLDMVHGLMSSLNMMEKVLNDVLSFRRMESGMLIQARKPFSFHKTINVVALSFQVQAEAAGLSLTLDLDKNIDSVGGCFVGDEMRLRQITSNLVSNALKFVSKRGVAHGC